MTKITGLFTLSLLLLIGSCTFDKEEVPEPTPTPTPTPTPPPTMDLCDSLNVTFSGTVVPLLNANCTTPGCHSAGSGNGDYTTYAGIKAKVDNGTFKTRVIDDKNMPPSGPLSPSDLDKLKCWLEDGAPNN